MAIKYRQLREEARSLAQASSGSNLREHCRIGMVRPKPHSPCRKPGSGVCASSHSMRGMAAITGPQRLRGSAGAGAGASIARFAGAAPCLHGQKADRQCEKQVKQCRAAVAEGEGKEPLQGPKAGAGERRQLGPPQCLEALVKRQDGDQTQTDRGQARPQVRRTRSEHGGASWVERDRRRQATGTGPAD